MQAVQLHDRPTNCWWPGHCDHTLTYTSHEVPRCLHPLQPCTVISAWSRDQQYRILWFIAYLNRHAKRCSWQGQLHEIIAKMPTR